MVDALFAVPRLADIYDALEPDRSDLDAYLAMVEEFRVSSVLDVGCGTGTLACLLAQGGKLVVGVDPASASLDVARRKPGADGVRWVHGDATTVSQVRVDLVTMTGNVAQVFVDDQDWAVTLASARAALQPGGRLVFESRDPAREAWRGWTRDQTQKQVDIPGVGGVETWVELTAVALPLVSFQTTFVFASDWATLTSHSTLRFRGQNETTASLRAAGFAVQEVRDARDRPGLEMVFVAAAVDE
jgi:SAM-dependent methyltransferase